MKRKHGKILALISALAFLFLSVHFSQSSQIQIEPDQLTEYSEIQDKTPLKFFVGDKYHELVSLIISFSPLSFFPVDSGSTNCINCNFQPFTKLPRVIAFQSLKIAH